MKVMVWVDQVDIDGGGRGVCNCPVALAMSRVFARNTMVGTVTYMFGGCVGEYLLPPRVVRFIDDLLHGKPLRPFGFVVDTDAQPAPSTEIEREMIRLLMGVERGLETVAGRRGSAK